MQNDRAPTQNDAPFRYREFLPLKLLPCRIFGDARESWPSLWTVSSHPPHPPHPPRTWVQVMCSAGMCASARHVIIPPDPTHPTHPVHGNKWCVRLVIMCASASYVIIPPHHPPHPPRAWVQVILMRPSDPNFWSQVTVKCGHKWPRALWRFCWPCQRMWRFVVVSDRTLWSQVTQILFFCLWSQVTGFCGRKWPPCRLQCRTATGT